ncbi:VOC family protein [Pseudonocardia sp. N23]|uniref:VOC family protein n=1 Tax=Pseudonocardia sp. N23 TaxID=1987376 RepID=UPI000BFE0373|nr:VOC family protein [Pseudonocardia sp. N23]GAY09117.1 possible dioxygenase [Pseudonocardia sp. N23]
MFRGFATVSFYADDLAAARDWYAELLGAQPYFAFPVAPAQPAYIEFRIGDDEDELGVIDRRWAPPGAGNAPGGAVMFWHVDDLEATVARLLGLGATEYEPITPRGDSGFVTASVVDPFGNVLGVMTNPHFAELHAARSPS